MTKRDKIRIFHIVLYVVLAVLIYLGMGTIRDFVYDYELFAAILLVVAIALPAYLHVFVILRKRKK